MVLVLFAGPDVDVQLQRLRLLCGEWLDPFHFTLVGGDLFAAGPVLGGVRFESDGKGGYVGLLFLAL